MRSILAAGFLTCLFTVGCDDSFDQHHRYPEPYDYGYISPDNYRHAYDYGAPNQYGYYDRHRYDRDAERHDWDRRGEERHEVDRRVEHEERDERRDNRRDDNDRRGGRLEEHREEHRGLDRSSGDGHHDADDGLGEASRGHEIGGNGTPQSVFNHGR